MTGLNWKSALLFVVIHRSLKGTGNASNGTGGAKFFATKFIGVPRGARRPRFVARSGIS